MRLLTTVLLAGLATTAVAAPVTYTRRHRPYFSELTRPPFRRHVGVARPSSIQQGHDRRRQDAKTGTVDISIDTCPSTPGHDKLNEHLKSPNSRRHQVSNATYKGSSPSSRTRADRMQGELTLHGVTKPVTLTIKSFKCMSIPMKKKEFCGADVCGDQSTAKIRAVLWQGVWIRHGCEARDPGRGQHRQLTDESRGSKCGS